MKPIILDDIVEAHKIKNAELVGKESAKPIAHTKLYDKYSFLINKQVRNHNVMVLFVLRIFIVLSK